VRIRLLIVQRKLRHCGRTGTGIGILNRILVRGGEAYFSGCATVGLVYISRMAALRSLAIGNARNSQEIARLSYEFATPYDRLQRRKEDFDMPIFIAICLRFRTAAVRTSYEINNDFGLGHMSLKCCECLAIVARLPYEFVRHSHVVFQHIWAWSLYCIPLLISYNKYTQTSDRQHTAKKK